MKTAQLVVTSCNRRDLELEQVRDFLRGNGFAVSAHDWITDPNADVIFLSTCGFTEAAENFGFETLHRIAREKKASAEIVLCGCIPEINPARVTAEFGGRTFSPRSYSRLDHIIAAEKPFDAFPRPNLVRWRATKPGLRDGLNRGLQLLKTFDGSFAGLQSIVRRVGNGVTRRVIRGHYANLDNPRTFYIQIQVGCSLECSYCTIRNAIGKLRSRPIDSILDDFRKGIRQGYTSFQLVGDNAGGYGLDIGTNLGELLQVLAAERAEFKIDLTDINPIYLHLIAEPVRTLASRRKLARLYVPIQSGSPRILRLMKRGCDMEQVKVTLTSIRKAILQDLEFKLGTSVIVGFPSETEEELQQTIDVCREVAFDWVWCHSFSARPETPAAWMEGQVSAAEILRRAEMIKRELSGMSLVTIAADTNGSRTCQG